MHFYGNEPAGEISRTHTDTEFAGKVGSPGPHRAIGFAHDSSARAAPDRDHIGGPRRRPGQGQTQHPDHRKSSTVPRHEFARASSVPFNRPNAHSSIYL